MWRTLSGLVIHTSHGVPLSRDLRVSSPVLEDGGWQSGRSSHPDFQKHWTEDRDRVTTDTIVRLSISAKMLNFSLQLTQFKMYIFKPFFWFLKINKGGNSFSLSEWNTNPCTLSECFEVNIFTRSSWRTSFFVFLTEFIF